VLTINGGSVSASSIQAQPTDGANPVYLNALTVGNPAVANAPVTAGEIDGVRCTQDGTGGYGVKDVRTGAGGKVYFYLTATNGAKKEVRLSAGGKAYGKSYIRDADDDNAQTLDFLANTVDIAAVPGVAAPVPMAVPVTAVGETAQYTGVVSWRPDPAASGGKFAFDTAYTATITLTAKPGYTFFGTPADFFTVAGATDARNARDSGDIEARFPATGARPSYTVTFDANGGSAVASRKVTDGAAIGSLPESSRTGYAFSGWYTERDDGSKVDPDAVVTGDVTYYARWTAEVCTVTFKDGSKTVKTYRKDYGAELGALPARKKKGHTLAGWYTAKSGGKKVGSGTKVAGDATYYAHWKTNVYNVKFRSGSRTVEIYRKAYGSELGELPGVKREGYAFKGWYTEPDGGEKVRRQAAVTKGVTYYARWALKASVRNATVVRMHKGPFNASPTVRFASRDMRMEYVSKTGNWCRVRAGDTVGYIYGRFVKLG
jgi:uncharacterized repeat protein (TIGR02543 family)